MNKCDGIHNLHALNVNKTKNYYSSSIGEHCYHYHYIRGGSSSSSNTIHGIWDIVPFACLLNGNICQVLMRLNIEVHAMVTIFYLANVCFRSKQWPLCCCIA